MVWLKEIKNKGSYYHFEKGKTSRSIFSEADQVTTSSAALLHTKNRIILTRLPKGLLSQEKVIKWDCSHIKTLLPLCFKSLPCKSSLGLRGGKGARMGALAQVQYHPWATIYQADANINTPSIALLVSQKWDQVTHLQQRLSKSGFRLIIQKTLF